MEDIRDGWDLNASFRAKSCTESIRQQRGGCLYMQTGEQYSRWGQMSRA